ncbi:MAG: aminotransferase class I/II-fold pyridoxal phosphate-dependent enzyme [Clostridia bacterium]|nr:aminotransferase class I/II-fold pyridoxal phosphate-dependent enzyme [Clostridia bacterium]
MLDHNKTPLYDALRKHIESRVIPFDVPGHKQGHGNEELQKLFPKSVLEADVNSMKSLDFLGNPISVIKEAEDLLADAYLSDESFFIVNGTTQAVQAMLMSAVNEGDTVILPRNVHKSAINAMILCGAKPHYMYPHFEAKFGMTIGVSLEEVKKAIEEAPEAKAIFLINPTYYGVISELKAIIEYAQCQGLLVIVDEAHGAHFPFHKELPKTAMAYGADMAAVSLHKTGGSLTQSSALLLNTRKIERDHVKTIVNLTQSTSASYLLMTSLDLTRKFLMTQGEKNLEMVLELARNARDKINAIDGLIAFSAKDFNPEGCYGFDETKLGVCVTGIGLTGIHVYDLLRDEYNIQVEMGDSHNILAIFSVGDTEKRVNQLVSALSAIAQKYKREPLDLKFNSFNATAVAYSPREAFYKEKERILITESAGRVSGEFVMIYPPGIPILAPGELITEEICAYIELLKREKGSISGLKDNNVEYLYCIKE